MTDFVAEFDKNRWDPFIANMDFSKDKYLRQCDADLEKSYESYKVYHDMNFREQLYYIVAKAVIFGYADRHSDDSNGIMAYVEKFYKDNEKELQRLNVRPEDSDKEWGRENGKYFDFVHSESYEYDPCVVFVDSNGYFPYGGSDAYLIRANDDSYDLITISKHTLRGDGYARYTIELDRFKDFMNDIYRITKDWKSSYCSPALDGHREFIVCKDVSLCTEISNRLPDNYNEYRNCLMKYFYMGMF